MKFRSLLALFAGLTLTMTVGGQLVTRLIAENGRRNPRS